MHLLPVIVEAVDEWVDVAPRIRLVELRLRDRVAEGHELSKPQKPILGHAESTNAGRRKHGLDSWLCLLGPHLANGLTWIIGDRDHVRYVLDPLAHRRLPVLVGVVLAREPLVDPPRLAEHLLDQLHRQRHVLEEAVGRRVLVGLPVDLRPEPLLRALVDVDRVRLGVNPRLRQVPRAPLVLDVDRHGVRI